MRYYADLHIHSKYSRATSKHCDLEHLTYWGRKKGINVLATGDFTHPAWIKEIQQQLVPAEPGLFKLRDDLERRILAELPPSCQGLTRFLLSVEISTIYKKGDKVRKIHHLVYAPTIEQAERINARLAQIGNIRSDGRPILGLDSRHLLEIVLEHGGADCFLIPAHIWTPWFAVLGSKSGFDSIADCYDDLAGHVFAAETGLSSDPEMNWRVSHLDRYRLVSNSDAHSPEKLGREACVFDTDLDYFALRKALETGVGYEGTLEFFPEEGKYHLDGHRKCGVRMEPSESKSHGGTCPVCRQPLTLGVMHRVDDLADRPSGEKPPAADEFKSLIPLPEILGETLRVGPTSKKVKLAYEQLVGALGSEFGILHDAPLDAIRKASSPLLAEAISRMREGRVIRDAGYDGEYGVIKLFTPEELAGGASVGTLFEIPKKALPSVKKGQSPFTPNKLSTTSPRKGTVPFSGETGDTLAALDPDQRRAAEIIDGPLLIVAGPGSGKTRTLTHRVAHLIAGRGAEPEQCLTITFTRKAADEMRQRLQRLLPDRWSRIPVMTFHAFAYDLLRQHRVEAGLPRGFRLSSDDERRALLVESLNCSARDARKLLSDVSRLKRKQERPAAAGVDDSAVADALAALARAKDEHGLVDYDDLMALAVELLDDHPKLQARSRDLYRWVSIDEYQDIDDLQYRLVRLLVPPDGNLCAIGDPDQAIYSFRGANVGFFLRFQQDFPGARTVQLSRNYRSGASILNASQQMIAPSSLVENRQLQALLDDTGKIVIHHARTDRAEAEFVTHTIEDLIGGTSFFSIDTGRSEGESRSYSFSDFAVLYRADSLADPLEEALARSGIPYQRNSHAPLNEHPLVQLLTRTMEDLDIVSMADRLRAALQQLANNNQPDVANDPVVTVLEAVAQRCDLATDEPETPAASGGRWERFLSEIHLGQGIDAWDDRADRVSLMTLHAAKGLEFPVVFIVGCEDGVLPARWGGKINDDLDEERRVFYVGMTRAKDRLFLSHAARRRRRGLLREQTVSPFLSAIEEELLERTASRARTKRREDPSVQLEMFG